MKGTREDELDMLVSVAIQRAERAEILSGSQSPAARESWLEVLEYERRLASMTSAKDVPGGVARAGAVAAALNAGQREEAGRLAGEYLSDAGLPQERRRTITWLLEEDERRAHNGAGKR